MIVPQFKDRYALITTTPSGVNMLIIDHESLQVVSKGRVLRHLAYLYDGYRLYTHGKNLNELENNAVIHEIDHLGNTLGLTPLGDVNSDLYQAAINKITLKYLVHINDDDEQKKNHLSI